MKRKILSKIQELLLSRKLNTFNYNKGIKNKYACYIPLRFNPAVVLDSTAPVKRGPDPTSSFTGISGPKTSATRSRPAGTVEGIVTKTMMAKRIAAFILIEMFW